MVMIVPYTESEDGLYNPLPSPPQSPSQESTSVPSTPSSRSSMLTQANHTQPPEKIQAPVPLQGPAMTWTTPTVVPQVTVTVPSIRKLNASQVTKIDQVLDSKKNNWPLWYDSITTMFKMNDVIDYVEGKIRCPDLARNPMGAKHWRQNNAYTKTLINTNISDKERIHTQGCSTAHKIWTNLKAIYESSNALMYTDKLQMIFQIRATEGSNIPEHLMRLKKHWDQLNMYNDQLVGDILFKRIIVQLLPHSWNAFTNPYIHRRIDKADKDPAKRITSQQLIGLIIQEYNLNESYRRKDAWTQKKSGKNSLSDRIGSSSGGNRGALGSREKRHCSNCG